MNNDTLFENEYKRWARSPEWELRNIEQALTTFSGWLNTPTENARLEAVVAIMAERKKAKKLSK